MAIDYGSYVQQAGQTMDFSPLQQGVQQFMNKNQEMKQLAVTRRNDSAWEAISNGLKNLSSKDVSQWSTNDFANMDAGSALNMFKGQFGNLKEEAANQGLFNPINFKQQYDQLRGSYMPMIEQKLATYKATNGLSDRDMQRFISTTPTLRNFLLDYGNPAGEARAWAKPYAPQGFIPGAVGEVASDPLRYGLSMGGAQAVQGAWSGAKDWKDFKGMGEGAKKGFARNWRFLNPNAGFGALRTTGLESQKELKGIADQLKKKGFGAKYDRRIKKVKDRIGKSLGGARGARTKDWKKYLGEKGHSKGNAPKWVKSKVVIDPKTGKPKLEYKGASKQQQNFLKTTKGKEHTAKILKGRNLQLKAQGKVGQGALRGLQGIIKKHGKAKVISTLAKKLGWKQAAKVAGKLIMGTALSGTGVGTAAGIAMNVWTIVDLYNILSTALEETGDARHPVKMAFGGGVKTEGADTYKIPTR
jgi:hypothetical protein